MSNYRVVFTFRMPETGDESGVDIECFLDELKKIIFNNGLQLRSKIEIIRTQGFPNRGKVTRVDK